MLTFNAILRSEAIDPAKVRLVRHKDTRFPGRPTPYNLWKANDGRFETYQRLQGRKVFSVGDILASFVATPIDETLFVGLYSVEGLGSVPPGLKHPIAPDDEDISGFNFYDIHRDLPLAGYAGRLTIEWGEAYRAWVQHADRQDKAVLEMRKNMIEEPFPGFREFSCIIDEITAIPLAWQEVLKSVKGVYLLVCQDTGKQYVGSAKGEESLWSRFLDYATTGHAGNIELKKRGRKPYQVTVLEVVNSDVGIERIEAAWKTKLMSRKFGLNAN